MQYGQRYRLLRVSGEVVEGKLVQTKGNDDYYPTFELDGGGLLGIHRDNVLGPVIDDCPVDGIPRPEVFTFVNPPSDDLLRKIIHLRGPE